MDTSDHGPTRRTRATRIDLVLGSVAALVTAGVVSWATPDGNLVVTVVPALVTGLVVYGFAARRRRGRGSG